MNDELDQAQVELIANIQDVVDQIIGNTEKINQYTDYFEQISVKALYDSSLQIIYEISNENWETLEKQQLHSILTQANRCARTLDQIAQNLVNENFDYDFRTQIITLHKNLTSFEKIITSYFQSNMGQKNAALEKKIIEKEKELEERAKQLAEKDKQIAEKELIQTQSESIDSSTDEASNFFSNNAEKYERTSLFWIRTVAAFSIITCFFSVIFLIMAFKNHPEITDENHYQFIRIAITSLFFLSFLLTITIWSARMYKSNLHLHSINKHKAVSLQVVHTLRAGGMTPEAKDVITTEAAKVIFSDPQTGLISDKTCNTSTSLTFSDLVKMSPQSQS